jgi:hypothetical protein
MGEQVPISGNVTPRRSCMVDDSTCDAKCAANHSTSDSNLRLGQDVEVVPSAAEQVPSTRKGPGHEYRESAHRCQSSVAYMKGER